MKRWHLQPKSERLDLEDYEAENPAADAFLADVVEVYRKHGLSLSHEDCHGGFIVEPLAEANVRWLMDAMVGPGEEES